MQFSRKHFGVIDFLYKLCHTIVTENVPDNVPEYITESEVLRQNAESDHQGHCPDQRLLGEHHFSCHQRPARRPARDQGTCAYGNAGGRVRAQHQCTTAEDPAVPQSGIRVKGTRNLFFSDFLVQLQRAATLYGYNGIVSYLDENANEIDAAEKILREIKPKGMIFLGGSVANFKKGFANITVPSVLTTLVSDELDFPNLSMVGVDDRAAAYAAVDYLIQQGHRKIAVLGGPVTSYPSVMRREGAQQAMRDAGILFSDKLYGLSNYDFESAYHAVNSLLAHRADFTALFAMSDVIALGAIRALVSAGLRVPEDVSVIGFDGITMSRYCVPVLTTIVQPSEQISLQSIELLVRQIEHGAPAQTITLQPELQQGESVRAI